VLKRDLKKMKDAENENKISIEDLVTQNYTKYTDIKIIYLRVPKKITITFRLKEKELHLVRT